MPYKIIAVDDEQDFLESIRRGLRMSGFKNVRTEVDPVRAAGDFEKMESYDIALIDISMPGLSGIELLAHIKSHSPRTECIMISAMDEVRLAVKCMQCGAYDYLIKPISREALVLSVKRAIEKRRLVEIVELNKKVQVPGLSIPQAFETIVTRSRKMKRILKEAELHAVSDMPILITGETGTGKELLAKAIHHASPRAEAIFLPINMDAITTQLFDAEFFGHTRGAFTGADRDRSGYLQTAHRGTLFLDEIGNLSYELQGKLLRVLQDGEFIKIGTSQLQKTDARIIAATNKDLDALIGQGRFRKDLYYRLKGGWLHLPPLRERRDDISALIAYFAGSYTGGEGIRFEEDVVALLHAHDYPGNVRELRSIVQSAINLASGDRVTTSCLPAHIRKLHLKSTSQEVCDLEPIVPLAQVEEAHIMKAYRFSGENKAQAAKILGIGINTLRRKLESYGIE